MGILSPAKSSFGQVESTINLGLQVILVIKLGITIDEMLWDDKVFNQKIVA